MFVSPPALAGFVCNFALQSNIHTYVRTYIYRNRFLLCKATYIIHMRESKTSTNINIRVNDATLSKLDYLVEECGYKSRSDCVKSLIEEKHAALKMDETIKATVKELIRSDEDIKAQLVKLIGELAAKK